MSEDPNESAPDIQGEGDYRAARNFDNSQEAFAKSKDVEKKARAAADALNGPEAEELEAARISTSRGAHPRPE